MDPVINVTYDEEQAALGRRAGKQVEQRYRVGPSGHRDQQLPGTGV
jgi:hypothetical protein